MIKVIGRPILGRFLPMWFYQKPTISRQVAFGEMQKDTER
jgi:hypothetical protein